MSMWLDYYLVVFGVFFALLSPLTVGLPIFFKFRKKDTTTRVYKKPQTELEEVFGF
jgi:hypothetical protein